MLKAGSSVQARWKRQGVKPSGGSLIPRSVSGGSPESVDTPFSLSDSEANCLVVWCVPPQGGASPQAN